MLPGCQRLRLSKCCEVDMHILFTEKKREAGGNKTDCFPTRVGTALLPVTCAVIFSHKTLNCFGLNWYLWKRDNSQHHEK